MTTRKTRPAASDGVSQTPPSPDPTPCSEKPAEFIRTLTAALLRISASLDLQTVLREVIDSARALTGAYCGCIVTISETGTPDDFVASGWSEEVHQRLAEWPEGQQFFAHVSNNERPFQFTLLEGYLRSIGLDADRLPNGLNVQSTPIRHRGIHVGNFYLAYKADGPEFTGGDEEILLLAAQAAAAIANARAYRAEQRTRADLEALIETSPVGVMVFDARTDTLMSFNRETRRIAESLGWPGQHFEDLLPDVTCRFADGREIVLAEVSIAEVLRGAESAHAQQVEISVPDGRRVTVLANWKTIPSEDGTLESVVITLQDLAAIEEFDRLRAGFFSMVSHELRAPLAAIRGSTTTALETTRVVDPAEMRQFLHIIDQQAVRMSGLIGDLLDAGRLDAGGLSVAPQPSEVAALVEQARTTFLASGRTQPLVIDLPPALPLVMADQPRVVQVLTNLLSNAARHSPDSQPIRITAECQDLHVALSVTDKGRGVAPEHLPHLFCRYSSTGESDGTVGTGLGLAICKGLVEAHGGRIHARSAGLGQGACFTFTVPIAEEADIAADGHAETPPARQARGAQQRILVVDDDPHMLSTVRHMLDEAGYAPIVTSDSQELGHLMRTRKPALVLLDLILPDTDGIELLHVVSELADLPVIFISGYGRDETIAKALDAGAEDYLVKPFSATELTARVRAALRRRTGPKEFRLGALTIDYARRRVRVAGRPVTLTGTEYELLRVLSLRAGQVFSHDSLLRQVWGNRAYSEPQTLVRTFIRSLRQKLGEDATSPAYILTQHGVGYHMATPDDQPEPARSE